MRSNMQVAAFVSYGGALGPRSVQQVGCDSYGLPVHSLIGSILLQEGESIRGGVRYRVCRALLANERINSMNDTTIGVGQTTTIARKSSRSAAVRRWH